MKSLYFDLLCGASGDMVLASLIDAGVPIGYLRGQLDKLQLHGLTIDCERVERGHITGMRMKIDEGHSHEHRNVSQILEIIRQGAYPDRVLKRCETVLMRLAQAEAEVHGIPVEKVHFHEIGAVDTIVDILGAALCLEYLDIEAVYFGELTEGHGTITVAHGVMPVPAPATAKLLSGLRLRTLDIPTEILTPTGCALLSSLGKQVAVMPAGGVIAAGHGCGTKIFEHHPNFLRVFVLDQAGPPAGAEEVAVLESEMDHISGEIMGYAAERLMESGALDVSWTPIFMKKGRPAYRIAVIGQPADAQKLASILMAETRTLGVRRHVSQRSCAQRQSCSAELDGRTIATKQCTIDGRTFTKAEYEDLAAIARQTGKPLIEVMEHYTKQH